uniref:Casein kinase 1 gamma C-terminal domain-containing protein n=1 Tax=Hucho hucho TaxID=62062 RepID=A0A4W5PUY4_9TELE
MMTFNLCHQPTPIGPVPSEPLLQSSSRDKAAQQTKNQSPEPKGSDSQPTPVTNRELLGSHLTADRLGGSVQVLGCGCCPAMLNTLPLVSCFLSLSSTLFVASFFLLALFLQH